MKRGGLKGCLTVILVVIVFLFAGIYFLTRERKPEIREGSYLEIDLSGNFPEEAPGDIWTQVVMGKPLTIYDIVEDIRKARYDDRIAGILVDVDFLDIGIGRVQEIRNALNKFRESGKGVISYIEQGRDVEYYLATAADKVYMPPVSMLLVDGISGSAVFIRGTLDKIGVKPNFVRIGDYKTAVDLFTRKEMSEAQRWSINSILDSVFSRYVADVAAARGLSEDRVREIIDAGLFDSRQALEEGLVDDLLYIDQLEEKLKGKSKKFEKVDAKDYRDVDPSSLGLESKTRFALITAEGAINTGESGVDQGLGKIVGSTTLVKNIKKAVEDKDIKAIILRVNSPGGSSVASDIVWGELEKAVEEKPVVISMSDLAASGGYYISMPASAIVAEPGTITGSIGVFAGKFNVESLYSKIGVGEETISRGKRAAMFSEVRDFTDEERQRLYDHLWEFYMNDFVRKVSEGRSIPPDSVDNIGRGRVWTGEQAVGLGLVDELGGLGEAIDKAKELAGVPAEQLVSMVIIPRPKGLLERLMEGDLLLGPRPMAFYPWLKEMAFPLGWLDMMGSGEIMAMMPFRIEFE